MCNLQDLLEKHEVRTDGKDFNSLLFEREAFKRLQTQA